MVGVALLALSLGFAPSGGDSAFSFRYETGWGDLIDTRDSTIARDNCSGLPVRGRATIRRFSWRGATPDPLPDDWQRMLEMGRVLRTTLYELPEYQALPHQPCMRQ